ncbi:S8 family serine peptidase [Flavobacterium sp. CS20]|uniref:S8 family serine peptidase n=1 Tax=Flavobacterium sp. CS20 TaxID=2775246 RepID=UPI001B39DCD8|nr:S8 family serine peptidase [Flavobacterium sp. CS20]QTY26642.1 S8 family serine peptidase [Flavobacterium sp. CS20]
MTLKHITSVSSLAISTLLLISCGSTGPKIVSTPIENIDTQPRKTTELTEDQKKSWAHLDLVNDTIPGMSVEKAYIELIKNYEGKNVIVAVLDSGIDIEHEDLSPVIWTNKDEVAGNNVDDDKNGYVDDIHGWNFLGDVVGENLEMTRIIKAHRDQFEGKTADQIPAAQKDEFELYKKAKAEYEKEVQQAQANVARYQGLLQQLNASNATVSKALGKEKFTKEEVAAMKAETESLQQSKQFMLFVLNNVGDDVEEAKKQIQGGVDYFKGRMDTHFNLDKDFRAEKLGDNPDDMSTKYYGNNQVMGPDPKKEDVLHGTHVAGIIGAVRNNGLGMKGVAEKVSIMPIRAVPDGDEYDKDIALGIRYAVDNGAKIINTSFGKYYSTHPDWVVDAIKYAADNDVLIVNLAGNEGLDLDKNRVYPNDEWPGQSQEIANNFVNVGAMTSEYGSNMIASFSNYGQGSVDVFAPGAEIYATVPNNEYKFLSGTSMASPNVAGVAAVIRSLFPKLTATQVKSVILDSGLSPNTEVILSGDSSKVKPFAEISETGNMVNLYNAIILASKMNKS